MKTICIGCLFAIAQFVVISRVAAQADAPSTVQASEEAAIRANADKYVEAYNRRDSKTMAAMWSPDAVYMDPITNEQIIGRDAIANQFDYVFAGSEDAKLAVTIDSVDFVSPNVAIEKGSAVVTYSDFDPEETTYSAVHVKRDGQWLIDRISEEDVPAPPPSRYEQLKELEWMVGSWVDSDGQSSVETDVEWTKNRNFLQRSFAVVIGEDVDMSGIQIIGWDPAEEQIRSWVFDSDGGFAEATWKHDGDQWLIQNNATLPDGGKATSLNILTYVDDDTFQWESINREVDGQLLPNVEAVTIVRDNTNAAVAASDNDNQ